MSSPLRRPRQRRHPDRPGRPHGQPASPCDPAQGRPTPHLRPPRRGRAVGSGIWRQRKPERRFERVAW